MSKIAFTLIIPCFNEEEGIVHTLESIISRLGEENYELVVVNDGSTDHSATVLQQFAQDYPNIKVVHHEWNRGYGASLKTGIRQASHEVIAITDADGTYPNERIPELVAMMKDADMVVGARTADDAQYPLIRKIPKVFLKAYASWLVGAPLPDLNSGMRVFKKSLAERYFKILPDGFSFTTTITMALVRNQYTVLFVPIGYSVRIGKSKIRPIRDTLRFMQLVLRTGMYFGPVRVFFPLVLLLSLAFIVSALYDIFVLSNLTDKTVLLLLFSMNTAMFALLADMIDKRSSS